ncbi:glutathione hydrolase 1 proenzyme-like [Puntigrus tetrazona]|uniref:glutathione hydrolase 1 proenzyme-like n=1 Tax=Puntigrus tetrazona TaxID=1606681 RepID=UPI001C8A9ABF|nr:glutathione hydrolase 1 proenzyme-like isoform X2 [Puntigrus tetrazona]XP_043119541.1 glutathione hydrolase 1 proenzyme-like [Puntigrus tetrazona]
MFDNVTKKLKPGLFIAVPGELRGYELAHKRSGKLDWRELFQPSIKLAHNGFKIGKALAKAIKENEETILNNASLCEVFCKSKNKIKEENDDISFPKLAETYKKIADERPNAFYNGSLTESIVKDITKAEGIIMREDLMNYKAELNEYALNFTVGNYTFHVPDAPFGGPVLALILNILKGKRPLSSMCPTIIVDKHNGKVKMVVGGEGGTNITTSVAQVILNYLFFGYDLQKAVEEPRVQIPINETNVEDYFVGVRSHTLFES